MATSAAIGATSDAILTLLQRAAKDEPDWTALNLNVRHFQSADLQTGLTANMPLTLSVFLYRVALSAGLRNVPVHYVNSEPLRPALPVDLFYLVTAWASEATMQQKLLGWAIRTIEDMATLPSNVLNEGGWSGVFAPAEAVELVWHVLTMQEEYDLWQVAQTHQQPSASYVARTVALESTLTTPLGPAVQVRELDYQLGAGR
jgi:uncharacterized protein DUF4255